MASDDVRWLYNVIFEQPTSTSDAALLVRVPTSLGGFGRLKRNKSKDWNILEVSYPLLVLHGRWNPRRATGGTDITCLDSE